MKNQCMELQPMEKHFKDLPDHVARCLRDFASMAIEAFDEDLVSIVLFGSAAEAELRPTSEVNLILVTKQFDVSQLDGIREVLRVAFTDGVSQTIDTFREKSCFRRGL